MCCTQQNCLQISHQHEMLYVNSSSISSAYKSHKCSVNSHPLRKVHFTVIAVNSHPLRKMHVTSNSSELPSPLQGDCHWQYQQTHIQTSKHLWLAAVGGTHLQQQAVIGLAVQRFQAACRPPTEPHRCTCTPTCSQETDTRDRLSAGVVVDGREVTIAYR